MNYHVDLLVTAKLPLKLDDIIRAAIRKYELFEHPPSSKKIPRYCYV